MALTAGPTFHASEWLSCGKKFPRPTPHYIAHALNAVLEIPLDAAISIPHSSQPLAALADYLLPKSNPATTVSFTFSAEPAQLNLIELPCLAVPEHCVIVELELALGQAWFDGKTSFTLPHICPRRLPLWCINYWFHILPALRVAASCKAGLTWCKSIGVRDDVETLMWSVSWGKGISWAHGGGSVDPGVLTERLLGHRWICDSTVGAMLSLVQEDILASDPRSTILVLPPQFASQLKPDRGFFNTYSRKRSPQLFRIGSQLANGALRAIYYSLNVGGTHWVAIGIEMASKLLLYGDSLDHPAPSSHFDLVDQWLSKHGIKNLARQSMPHALQDDGYSCGVVHVNAIAHRVLQTPLWQPATKNMARVEWFQRILEAHVNRQLAAKPASALDCPAASDTVSPAHHDDSLSGESHIIDLETHTQKLFHFDEDKALHASSSASSVQIPPSSPNTSPSAILGEASPLAPHAGLASHPTAGAPASKLPAPVPTASSGRKVVNRRAEPATKASGAGLFRFLKTVSHEEYLEQTRRTAEQQRERREELREQEDAKQQAAANRKRNLACARKQDQRAREVQADITAGIRSADGTLLKPMHLQLDTPQSNQFDVTAASRPLQQYKLIQRSENPRSRPRTEDQSTTAQRTTRQYTNWAAPLLWQQIKEAGEACRPKMRPCDIQRYLVLRNPTVFGDNKISQQVIGRMIDGKSDPPRWDPEWLQTVELDGVRPGGHVNRHNILTLHPSLYERVKKTFESLRATGVSLSIIDARGIIIGFIENDHPELFERQTKSGERFRATERWVRKTMANEFGWSRRSATRAAQKVPGNHEELCLQSFLRQSMSIRDYAIDAALRANIDQTMVVLQDTGKLTYNPRGAKQVSVIGVEEKRSFTVLVGVTASGALLPFQVIMKGKSKVSIPRSDAPMWNEASDLGFEFVWSNTDTHWSTQQTMRQYIDNILAPHFTRVKHELGLPAAQECLLQLDCWSVHRSDEFRSWLKTAYPWIKLDYVPGGCTGIWQPCDVGMQRGLKHVIRRCQHADVVDETQRALRQGTAPEEIKPEISLPVLRQRSVRWLVQAYKEMNDPAIIKRAFEHCSVGAFNLSHESLTSYEALKKLRDVQAHDPTLWAELNSSGSTDSDNDEVAGPPDFDDASDRPLADVLDKAYQHADSVAGRAAKRNRAQAAAEQSSDDESDPDADDIEDNTAPGDQGAPSRPVLLKRKRSLNDRQPSDERRPKRTCALKPSGWYDEDKPWW